MNQLTVEDHDRMNLFIGGVLDAYRDQAIERSVAITELTHVLTLHDDGVLGELRAWFRRPYQPAMPVTIGQNSDLKR